MAVKHKIRTKTGFKTVILTPAKAIRKNCYECCGYNHAEVRRCEIKTCCFYPFKVGNREYRRKHSVDMPLKSNSSSKNTVNQGVS